MNFYNVQVKTDIQKSGYESLDLTEEQFEQMMSEAADMAHKSYAPYSKFHVGAVALLENGEMVSGSNQENAAYPSGLCAERTTVFYTNAHYPNTAITHLMIYAETEESGVVVSPISPCAACRQVLIEKESIQGSPIKLILVGRDSVYVIPSARDLVPLSFVPDSLKGE
ncbi:MAG: cytidine deaminase [Bacteroidales bacterium]|nr:cytidine deaminase [Bacteroidales bacterium]